MKNSIYPITKFKKKNLEKNSDTKKLKVSDKKIKESEKPIEESHLKDFANKQIINTVKIDETPTVETPVIETPIIETPPVETPPVETIPPKQKRKYTKRQPKEINSQKINPKNSIDSIKSNETPDQIQETPAIDKSSLYSKLEAKTTLYSLNVAIPTVLGLFSPVLKRNKEKLELSNNEINQLEQPTQAVIDYYDIKLHPLVVLSVMIGGIYANKVMDIMKSEQSTKEIKIKLSK